MIDGEYANHSLTDKICRAALAVPLVKMKN